MVVQTYIICPKFSWFTFLYRRSKVPPDSYREAIGRPLYIVTALGEWQQRRID